MITLTDAAADKVRQLIDAEGDPSLALRVSVVSSGCSGFSYDLFFDSDVSAADMSLTYGSVTVVVDQGSASLLDGATLDYADGLEAGFSITNPNASHGCGCGKSG